MKFIVISPKSTFQFKTIDAAITYATECLQVFGNVQILEINKPIE